MGGRSGQGINSGLTNYANTYAKSIGLNKKDFNISFDNLGDAGGDVSFVKVEGTNIYKLKNEVRINSNMSEERKQQIIRHELTHVKQSKENRLYIDGSRGRKGGLYWEGKKYMSLSSYQKILKGTSSKNLEIRVRNTRKYRSLPWEVEARSSE
tara:strand:+ start:1084 stop:1542 length:459 start_codon:yes stop_codon:yes gene_type:complete